MENRPITNVVKSFRKMDRFHSEVSSESLQYLTNLKLQISKHIRKYKWWGVWTKFSIDYILVNHMLIFQVKHTRECIERNTSLDHYLIASNTLWRR